MSSRPASSAGAVDDARVPSYPRVRAVDAAWYRTEQLLCGVMFLAMSVLVFLAVVRDIFGTRREWTDAVILLVFVYGAVRTRAVRDGERRLGRAAAAIVAVAITAAVVGAVVLYVELLPGGFIWAPKMALCLMLWVALLGASIATYERAHLALEFGEKLWPARILVGVRAFAHALTSAFCLVLLWLSYRSLLHHYGSWAATDGFGGNVPSIDWLPEWVVFLILPYTFAAMAVRVLAQSYTIATGTDEAPVEQLPT